MSDQANLSSLYDLIGKIGAPNVRRVKMHPDTCKHLRGAGHIQREPDRFPDHIISGPELPADDAVRRRLFGES
jgi:hypothetical protein